ncbi:nuclear transport factor 2 family protein [Jatrophihabitans telluris]|uniref:Nuclear transport factor 2 family protein n=1 Tax=Jatrophihabitans telluris TaxID=2038343 RepID=A0ABY4QWY2_9ACTN|nr:nuclear transport factor 2 family protein [Jatrophihabitans telluris]UQX87444.1 nuclear transport factor 2 family protein [Jatrophihabitans telluris]
MNDPRSVIDHLVQVTNDHDLNALVDCFAPDYVNQTPAHPARGFLGRDQVRRNWATIFAGVPDLSVRVVAAASDGDEAWTEWQMAGTRVDGQPHAMAGVIVFVVRQGLISSGRFYLEPLDVSSGNADTAVDRLINGSAS